MQCNKDVVTSINFVITLSRDKEGGGMKCVCAGMQNFKKYELAVICICVSFLVWFKMNKVLLLLAQGFIPYVNVIDIRNDGI